MSDLRPVLLAAVLVAVAAPALAQPRPDRSGVYEGRIGEIAILEGPDAIIFAYWAVVTLDRDRGRFCDWTDWARRDAPDRFVWRDADLEMRLIISFTPSQVTMRGENGTMCGQGLGDDDFAVKSRRPPQRCRVTADRAAWFALPDEDEPRGDSLPRGTPVDVVEPGTDDARDFLLARATSGSTTVIGLLRVADVQCPGR